MNWREMRSGPYEAWLEVEGDHDSFGPFMTEEALRAAAVARLRSARDVGETRSAVTLVRHTGRRRLDPAGAVVSDVEIVGRMLDADLDELDAQASALQGRRLEPEPAAPAVRRPTATRPSSRSDPSPGAGETRPRARDDGSRPPGVSPAARSVPTSSATAPEPVAEDLRTRPTPPAPAPEPERPTRPDESASKRAIEDARKARKGGR